jgi:hypothetical protein
MNWSKARAGAGLVAASCAAVLVTQGNEIASARKLAVKREGKRHVRLKIMPEE